MALKRPALPEKDTYKWVCDKHKHAYLPELMQRVSDQQDLLHGRDRVPGTAQRGLVVTIAAKTLQRHKCEHLLPIVQNDLSSSKRLESRCNKMKV